MKHILIAVAFIGLLSCNNNTTKKNTKTATPKTELVKGILVLGHEVAELTPCNSNTAYWVTDKTTKLMWAYESTVGENPKPYTPVYCEVEVNKLPKATDGFAEDYEGVFEVTAIKRVAPLSLEQNCNPEKTKSILENNDIINVTYINDKNEKLYVLYYTKEHQAIVTSLDKLKAHALKNKKPASGIWYKNDSYELRGKGKEIEFKKDGKLLFKGSSK